MANIQLCKLKQKQKQNGVILLVTLLALVIIMLSSLALVRSTDTNMILAGNYAFKRDVVNQAERAVPAIRTLFTTGALQLANSRNADNTSVNYYASTQPNNAQGIPNVLFAVANNNANNIVDAKSGVTVRYVIDRMSLATGAPTIANGGYIAKVDSGGGDQVDPPPPGSLVSVYRISIRATGPRNTETFLQVIFQI